MLSWIPHMGLKSVSQAMAEIFADFFAYLLNKRTFLQKPEMADLCNINNNRKCENSSAID